MRHAVSIEQVQRFKADVDAPLKTDAVKLAKSQACAHFPDVKPEVKAIDVQVIGGQPNGEKERTTHKTHGRNAAKT